MKPTKKSFRIKVLLQLFFFGDEIKYQMIYEKKIVLMNKKKLYEYRTLIHCTEFFGSSYWIKNTFKNVMSNDDMKRDLFWSFIIRTLKNHCLSNRLVGLLLNQLNDYVDLSKFRLKQLFSISKSDVKNCISNRALSRYGSFRMPSPKRTRNPFSGSISCVDGSFRASITAVWKALSCSDSTKKLKCYSHNN